MDKTARTETRRIFLLHNLPEPLTRASRHLQIFDNYIENTRLRLRSVRIPETKTWTWILQQIEQIFVWVIVSVLLIYQRVHQLHGLGHLLAEHQEHQQFKILRIRLILPEPIMFHYLQRIIQDAVTRLPKL